MDNKNNKQDYQKEIDENIKKILGEEQKVYDTSSYNFEEENIRKDSLAIKDKEKILEEKKLKSKKILKGFLIFLVIYLVLFLFYMGSLIFNINSNLDKIKDINLNHMAGYSINSSYVVSSSNIGS